jgi:SAM-dependent methyltransferase
LRVQCRASQRRGCASTNRVQFRTITARTRAPRSLVQSLHVRTRSITDTLNGSGRLLDAGCGPGILTVGIAHLCEEAVGLDPDPAMLAEGRRAAHEQGITNIRRVQALAEDLPGAAPGPYRVVTLRAIFAPGIPDLLRDSESVLSGYFSLSSSAPHLFGDRVEDFASEVWELLTSRSPEGIFWDWPR